MSKPVCAVVGVGPGNGAACARAFSLAGYQVALLARNLDYLESLAGEIEDSRALQLDVTNLDEIESVLGQVENDMGPVDVLVYNAGSGSFKSIDDTAVEEMESSWRINTLGCFAAAKQIIPSMRENGFGSIIVIGATASLRGGATTAAFASAKAAQRSLAQSMARHLGPDGIHVGYLIIDGMIDLERTRQAFPDRPQDAFIRPEDVAEAALYLVRQPKSGWTFELDLRPSVETW